MIIGHNALRILFVLKASAEIGYGHFNRCITVASHAQSLGFEINFAVFGDVHRDFIELAIRNRGVSVCNLIVQKEFTAANTIKLMKLQINVVLMDVLDSKLVLTKQVFRALNLICAAGPLSVFIDSLGDNSIINHLSKIYLDIVVRPYEVKSSLKKLLTLPINLKILEGSKYALLGSEYLNLPNREPRQSANRVLITCGGSDTKGYTLEILRGLDGIALSLEIRVVLGPMFNEQLCSLVELHAMESHHKILIIKNTSSILDGMLWCDLAISANGLTKYELAASGTPSIQFSIDEHHSYANLEFSKKNTAIDVGVGIDKNIIAREVSAALSSEKLRGEMIQAGKHLVDGAGVKRLLNEIMRSYFAKK